ncbi:MAG: hypothetical protein R2762_11445 [Bryobacteraceae bacterium]
MTLTIHLRPEIERSLLVKARAKGVPLADYAREVLVRDAQAAETPRRRTGQEMIDVCARVRGMADDLVRNARAFRKPAVPRMP